MSDWIDLIAKFNPEVPESVDELIDGDTAATGSVFYRNVRPAPPASLWLRQDESDGYIGIRVTSSDEATPSAAMGLAAIAAERSVVPIILSHAAICGFERFGIRVETIAGQTEEERAACEAEVVSFWGIPIVIDLSAAIALK